MNPVPIMKLVEVIRGLQTSDETTADTRALAESMGKTPVLCRDFPGFISNRVLMPMINEAIFCLHEGLGEDKYRPCPLLAKYVEAGWLGKKTGRGFCDYSPGAAGAPA